jgi:RNA polymerase subunit RPABC4/transcription elongation factor Spt4
MAATRCKRCSTILRNNRTVCPCCGWDLNAPVETAAAGGEAPVERGPRKVVAKAGVRMCPICMSSVPEEQLVEVDSQKICPTCAENMKNKAAKKAAGPPPVMPDKK